MKNSSNTEKARTSSRKSRFTRAASTAWLSAFVLSALAAQAAEDRTGKEVVQTTCGTCHTPGKDGAPMIGDKQAWGKLASHGLTSLTQTALVGIRKMPAHGGSAENSDVEISRAITYMVNQSGGKWTEPVGKPALVAATGTPTARTGKQIVELQCGKCHTTGENGAPKVGDRDAWVMRLKRGFDDVARSAFNGHGPMPARGGLADITINEMRNAITYMFNPASAHMVPTVATNPVPRDPNHKTVGNAEVFFGITTAASIRAAQKTRSAISIANVPKSGDYYHVNISLRDRRTNVLITDAQVEARVEDLAMRGETKALDIIAVNTGISYGGFFELPTKGRYGISVKIQRPDSQPAEVKFEFNRN